MKPTSFIAALLLATAVNLQAQVRLDGSFSDWNALTASYQETAEELESPDLSAFTLSNDEEYLYLHIEADKEYKLHDREYPLNPAEVEIYLDTDNNAATGFAVEDMGAELIIKTGQRRATYYGEGEPRDLNLHRLDLVSLPTVSSRRYEIAISRMGIDEGATPLFGNSSFRLLIKELNSGDILPNEGAFTYTFQDELQQEYTPISVLQEEIGEPQLRLKTHNTENDGLADRNRKERFARLYQAVAPDILTLNENWDTPPSEAKAFMDEYLPLNTADGWQVSKLVYGNITLSKYPIVQNWVVSSGERLAASLIDLPDSLFRRDILVINAHLQCCDQDNRRQRQVDATMQFMLDAQTQGGVIDLPANTPMVLAGDLNLVGNAQQLSTLLNGTIQDTDTHGEGRLPDWDQSPLEDLHPLQTDHPFAYTWRNPYGSFPPSRLDFFLYTGSTMEARKGFILNPGAMPQETLDALRIQKEDVSASDHFAVVTDFSLQGCQTSPQEVVFTGLPDSLLIHDAAVILEGQPANGAFWGPGIEENTFVPSSAGPGLHQIKYTIWNEEGCSSSFQQAVRVVGCESMEVAISFSGLPDTMHLPTPAVELAGTPANGVFSGPGISGATFDPAIAGEGKHTIIYTIQAENGCSYSHSREVVIRNESPNGLTDPMLEQLSLRPNPAGNRLWLQLSEPPAAPIELTVFNVWGRRLSKTAVSQELTEISLQDFPKGLLLIQLRSEKGQKTYRIIHTKQ